MDAEIAADPYSRTRIAVPNGTPSEWLFPQEKATLKTLNLGT
jgi:hypothetical protein